MFSRSKKRSSERTAAILAAVLFAPWPGHGALTDEESTALGADVKLYAEGYACDEEPLAEQLRSTVLLIVAGSGKTATDVVEARQRFLDGLRDRARSGGRPGAGACTKAVGDLRARLRALQSVRLEPSAPR